MSVLMDRMFRSYLSFIKIYITLFIYKTKNFSLRSEKVFYAFSTYVPWAISPIKTSLYLTCSEILWAILSTLSSKGFSL